MNTVSNTKCFSFLLASARRRTVVLLGNRARPSFSECWLFGLGEGKPRSSFGRGDAYMGRRRVPTAFYRGSGSKRATTDSDITNACLQTQGAVGGGGDDGAITSGDDDGGGKESRTPGSMDMSSVVCNPSCHLRGYC
jgi:hypothetical protein